MLRNIKTFKDLFWLHFDVNVFLQCKNSFYTKISFNVTSVKWFLVLFIKIVSCPLHESLLILPGIVFSSPLNTKRRTSSVLNVRRWVAEVAVPAWLKQLDTLWLVLCFILGAGSPVAGAQPHQLPLGSLHISPVQTAFEPSSVPYYLQQDLEALHRVSQQYASPPLSQQSNSVVQGSLLTTHAQSSVSPRVKRHGRGSRRLSLDPYTKLRVEKLEVVSSICFFSSVYLV